MSKRIIKPFITIISILLLAVAVFSSCAYTAQPVEREDFSKTTAAKTTKVKTIDKNGSYTSKEDVALYIHTYGELPSNFITKKEAERLGWDGGSLEPYAPGKSIGGSYFGNYEGKLPKRRAAPIMSATSTRGTNGAAVRSASSTRPTGSSTTRQTTTKPLNCFTERSNDDG